MAGAGEQQCRALAALGEAVGTAYQITDDLADLDGVRVDGAETKRVAEDLYNAKVTYPLALAVGLLPRGESARLWDIVRGGHLDESAVTLIVKELDDCGAMEQARDHANSLLRQAWKQTRSLLDDTPAVRALSEMCAATVQRIRIA